MHGRLLGLGGRLWADGSRPRGGREARRALSGRRSSSAARVRRGCPSHLGSIGKGRFRQTRDARFGGAYATLTRTSRVAPAPPHPRLPAARLPVFSLAWDPAAPRISSADPPCPKLPTRAPRPCRTRPRAPWRPPRPAKHRPPLKRYVASPRTRLAALSPLRLPSRSVPERTPFGLPSNRRRRQRSRLGRPGWHRQCVDNRRSWIGVRESSRTFFARDASGSSRPMLGCPRGCGGGPQGCVERRWRSSRASGRVGTRS